MLQDLYGWVDPANSYKLSVVMDRGRNKGQRKMDSFKFQILLNKSHTKGVCVELRLLYHVGVVSVGC